MVVLGEENYGSLGRARPWIVGEVAPSRTRCLYKITSFQERLCRRLVLLLTLGVRS